VIPCCSCDAEIKECMGFMGFPHGEPFVSKPEMICGLCAERLTRIMEYGYPPIRLDAAR
jgi:hypothetical protein